MNHKLIDTIENKFNKINTILSKQWLKDNIHSEPVIVEDYYAKYKVLAYLTSQNGWSTRAYSTEQLLELTGNSHKTYNKNGNKSIILNELSKFDKSYNEWFAQVWLTLLDKIPIDFFTNERTEPLKIFDAGSAAGAFLYPIKQALLTEYGINVEIDGVDISSECIGFANIVEVGGHDNWKIGNIFNLKHCFIPRFDENDILRIQQCEIEDDTYDIVISNGVFFCLDHIKQLQAFNECMRITKPGGYLLIGRNNNSKELIENRKNELISWEYTLFEGGSLLRKLKDSEEDVENLVILPDGTRCQQIRSFFNATYYQYPCPNWDLLINQSQYNNTKNLGVTQCSDLWGGNRTCFDVDGSLLGYVDPFDLTSLRNLRNLKSTSAKKLLSLKNISLEKIVHNKGKKYFLSDAVYELRNNVTFKTPLISNGEGPYQHATLAARTAISNSVESNGETVENDRNFIQSFGNDNHFGEYIKSKKSKVKSKKRKSKKGKSKKGKKQI